MTIIQATVFDPALSGDETLQPRLNILTDFLYEEPINIYQNRDWIADEYDPFYGFTHKWDENIETDVGLFNTSRVLDEPLFPVTVSVGGDMWLEYYMKVSRVRKLLRRFTGEGQDCNAVNPTPWTLVLDDTAGLKGKLEYRLVNPSKACVRCFQKNGKYMFGIEEMQVAPGRLAWLCRTHRAEFNVKAAAERKDG